jgi:hypothetical protein
VGGKLSRKRTRAASISLQEGFIDCLPFSVFVFCFTADARLLADGVFGFAVLPLYSR